MQRNYLKGFIGDQINLLMAAVAFNLKKWMNNFFTVLFLYRILFLGIALCKIEAKERQKYTDLYLLWFRVW
jgi:IS5 family transposase